MYMSDHSAYGHGSHYDDDNFYRISPHIDLQIGNIVKFPIVVPISYKAIDTAYDIYKYFGFLYAKYKCMNLDVYKKSEDQAKTINKPANN